MDYCQHITLSSYDDNMSCICKKCDIVKVFKLSGTYILCDLFKFNFNEERLCVKLLYQRKENKEYDELMAEIKVAREALHNLEKNAVKLKDKMELM